MSDKHAEAVECVLHEMARRVAAVPGITDPVEEIYAVLQRGYDRDPGYRLTINATAALRRHADELMKTN